MLLKTAQMFIKVYISKIFCHFAWYWKFWNNNKKKDEDRQNHIYYQKKYFNKFKTSNLKFIPTALVCVSANCSDISSNAIFIKKYKFQMQDSLHWIYKQS